MSRVLRAALNAHWAMEENALRNLLRIAARENASIDAVQAELGRPLDNTREVTVRDGIAIVPITGPIFRYASFFSRISGASGLGDIATDFNEAMANPGIRGILLEIDSPGGGVAGISDFARMVFESRGQKPITAFIDGDGASAAYWIASAADEVVVADTAIVGSIGVRATINDYTEAKRKAGVETIEIVSSQSPRKVLDPRSEEGRADLQAILDELAGVFVSAVARHRGVGPETVLSDFGQGGVFIGQSAVEAGLADRVGTIEEVLAEMAASPSSRVTLTPAAGGGPNQTKEASMADKTTDSPEGAQEITAESLLETNPELVAQFREEGAKAGAEKERARIVGILQLDADAEDGALVVEMANDPECDSGEAAKRLRKAESNRRVEALKADENALDIPPASSSRTGDDGKGTGASAVLSALNKARGGTPVPA